MTTTAITTPTTLPSTTTMASTTGTNALTSSDFMNLMLKQLQNQDPLNPTDSNQLLEQISQISTLQSNTQLQTSLTSMTLQQSIGAAGNLIGKSVQGLDANGNKVAGNVTAVAVQNQQVYLQLDSTTTPLPLTNVLSIAQQAAPATPTVAGTSNALTSIANTLKAFGFG